jgi:hypothetical protein
MLENKIIENEKIHNKIAKKYNYKHIEIYNNIEQSRINNIIIKLLNKNTEINK